MKTGLAPLVLAAVAVCAAPETLISQTASEATVVRFSLVIDGTQQLQAAANYGKMITVQIEGRGSYGFVPEMRSGSSEVQVQVFELGTGEHGRTPEHLETVHLAIDSTVALTADPGISIRIYKAEVSRAESSAVALASLVGYRFSPFAGAASGECCVTCDNVTACGCAVTMSCDCCCAGCSNPDCPECVGGLAGGSVSGGPCVSVVDRFFAATDDL